MNRHPTKSRKKGHTFVFLSLAFNSIFVAPLFLPPSRAQPFGGRNADGQCYPNDPDGANPGNLCLTYPSAFDPQSTTWSPLPNTSTDQPPFIQGLGKEAYYGYPTSPTKPGRVIGTTTGYWTNVEAVNGSTTITDSTGKIITAP